MHPSPPCLALEACRRLAVEEGHRETQAVVVVAEVPSQVRVEVVGVLACQGGVEGVEVLACQEGVAVVEVLACLVKEEGEEEEEYRHNQVKEGGVGEKICMHGLVGVGAEGACLYSGQGEEGQAVEGGANRVLAQEQ